MNAMILRAGALLLVAALPAVGCGGTSATSASASAETASLSCKAAMPFAGNPPHTAVSSSLFPTATDVAAINTPMPAALSALLNQQVTDILRKTGAPAINAAIKVPGLGYWNNTQGLARTNPAQTVTEATEFYWGSVAKPLTAVLVLQLVEEKKLSLDDPLSRWFPQIPQAGHIRISHLLAHTSGLQTNINSASGVGVESPAQQLSVLSKMPLLFCPGTNASYSNVGYLLLALIVENIEQQPLHQSMQRRIAAPLGLQHLRVLRPGEDTPTALATPHEGQIPKNDPTAWTRLGAGNVVARAEDMAVFWQAVLSGRLLTTTTVQAQWAVLNNLGPQTANTRQGMQWFGQGVMLMEWTDEKGHPRTWLGHTGGIPTANAVLVYDPTAHAYTAVAVNSAVSSAAVANALLKVVLDWREQH